MIPRELQPIARAGSDGLDLVMDDAGRWWAVPPVTWTRHRHRFEHEATYWLVRALGISIADGWRDGTLSPDQLANVHAWLSDCAVRASEVTS
jgi:hypothetical protein